MVIVPHRDGLHLAMQGLHVGRSHQRRLGRDIDISSAIIQPDGIYRSPLIDLILRQRAQKPIPRPTGILAQEGRGKQLPRLSWQCRDDLIDRMRPIKEGRDTLGVWSLEHRSQRLPIDRCVGIHQLGQIGRVRRGMPGQRKGETDLRQVLGPRDRCRSYHLYRRKRRLLQGPLDGQGRMTSCGEPR